MVKKIKKQYKSHNKNMQKKGIEMSFDWIFASIVGGAILVLAIYFAVQFGRTGASFTNTQMASAIRTILDPQETGLASGKGDELHFSKKSKLFFQSCDETSGVFGEQTIAFTEKFFKDYGEKGKPIPLNNKYVFANETLEGKDFYIISRPFFMAYKIADIIIIDSNNYCFYQAPEEIKSGLEQENSKGVHNINFTDDITCEGIKVCFDIDNPECQISVFGECSDHCKSQYDYGRVLKYDGNGRQISESYYINSLIYGAIFSSSELYECNVKRLMSKYIEVSKVYIGKINIINQKGCNSNAAPKINNVINEARQIFSSDTIGSKGLITVYPELKDIESVNNAALEGCQLFESE